MGSMDQDNIAAEVQAAAAAEPEQVERERAAQKAASQEKADRNRAEQGKPPRKPKPKLPEGVPPRELIHRCHRRAELGAAELAAFLLKGSHLYDNFTKDWFKFNCTIWEQDLNRQIEEKVDLVASLYETEAKNFYKLAKKKKDEGKKSCIYNPLRNRAKEFKSSAASLRNQNKINNVLKMLRRGTLLGMESSDLEPHRELLPTAKTVVNLRDGTEYTDVPWPELHFRHKSPWEYKGTSEPADFWEDTLQKVFCGDAELIEYFEYFVGFCVTGVQPKNFFVFLGQFGDNGKSVIFDTIQKGLGEFASTVKVEMLLVDKFAQADKPSPSLVDLRGRRMAVASEADENQQFSTAKIKLLTSASDRIKARTLNKGDEEFFQTHTLCLHTNNVPKLKGADNAFLKNRLRIFPCNARFVDPEGEIAVNEANYIFPMLPESVVTAKLEAESSGILGWMVACAMKALELGHMPPPPKAILEQNAEYEEEQDWLAQFLSDCCEPDPDAKYPNKDLHLVFKLWFRDSNNLTAKDDVWITPNKMGRELSKRPDVKKIPKGTQGLSSPHYCGWRLKDHWVEAAKSGTLPIDKSEWPEAEQGGFQNDPL